MKSRFCVISIKFGSDMAVIIALIIGDLSYESRIPECLLPIRSEAHPDAFGIVTAYNSNGITRDENANLSADERLLLAIDALGVDRFRITGMSLDEVHREPGWGIQCSKDNAIRLGRQFEQEAIFWVSGVELILINLENLDELTLGAFTDSEGLSGWSVGTDCDFTILNSKPRSPEAGYIQCGTVFGGPPPLRCRSGYESPSQSSGHQCARSCCCMSATGQTFVISFCNNAAPPLPGSLFRLW